MSRTAKDQAHLILYSNFCMRCKQILKQFLEKSLLCTSLLHNLVHHLYKQLVCYLCHFSGLNENWKEAKIYCLMQQRWPRDWALRGSLVGTCGHPTQHLILIPRSRPATCCTFRHQTMFDPTYPLDRVMLHQP